MKVVYIITNGLIKTPSIQVESEARLYAVTDHQGNYKYRLMDTDVVYTNISDAMEAAKIYQTPSGVPELISVVHNVALGEGPLEGMDETVPKDQIFKALIDSVETIVEQPRMYWAETTFLV